MPVVGLAYILIKLDSGAEFGTFIANTQGRGLRNHGIDNVSHVRKRREAGEKACHEERTALTMCHICENVVKPAKRHTTTKARH